MVMEVRQQRFKDSGIRVGIWRKVHSVGLDANGAAVPWNYASDALVRRKDLIQRRLEPPSGIGDDHNGHGPPPLIPDRKSARSDPLAPPWAG